MAGEGKSELIGPWIRLIGPRNIRDSTKHQARKIETTKLFFTINTYKLED